MLEEIALVDATHCQDCLSQFTFINRKHHCRRCGGLFCNSCAQPIMVLHSQGNTRVCMCNSCKRVEEAARSGQQQGCRADGGSSESIPSDEDEVLIQIFGRDGEKSFSSSTISTVVHSQTSVSSASSSCAVVDANEGDVVIQKTISNDDINNLGSASPDDLWEKVLEKKKKYEILEGDVETAMALIREISSIIEDIHRKSGEDKGSGNDKTRVVALKKRALALKREGKLAEAKEELKRAKVLEKQLETEDSDDEAPKSRSTIRNEIRNLTREAIAFRREEKLDEAVEALRKCEALQLQLELMRMFKSEAGSTKEEPAANSSVLDSSAISSYSSRRSKGDVSSMGLRARLEARIQDMEKQMRERPLYVSNHEKPVSSVCGALSKEDGPSDENVGSVINSSDLSSCDSLESIGMFAEKLRQSICSLLASSGICSEASSNKREIEEGILALKRKAIALKRRGQNEKALHVWGFAIHLQAIM